MASNGGKIWAAGGAIVVAGAIGLAYVLWPSDPQPDVAPALTVAPLDVTTPIEPAIEPIQPPSAETQTAALVPLAAPAILRAPPTFDVVRIEPDGTAVIAGVADGAGRIVLLQNGTALPDASAIAGPDGQFVMLTTVPVSTETQYLELGHYAEEAIEPLVSTAKILVAGRTVVPDPEPQESVVAPENAEAEAEPEAPKLLLADEDGVRVIQSGGDQAPIVAVVLDTISYDDTGDVALGGRATSDKFVRVYLDNAPITTSPVDDSGHWTTDLADIETGVYTLRVDELNAQGEVTSRIETPFKRESLETLAAVSQPDQGREIATYAAKTIQPGATLWEIARERYGSGTQYLKVFEANRDIISDPNLIFPGQVFRTPD